MLTGTKKTELEKNTEQYTEATADYNLANETYNEAASDENTTSEQLALLSADKEEKKQIKLQLADDKYDAKMDKVDAHLSYLTWRTAGITILLMCITYMAFIGLGGFMNSIYPTTTVMTTTAMAATTMSTTAQVRPSCSPRYSPVSHGLPDVCQHPRQHAERRGRQHRRPWP